MKTLVTRLWTVRGCLEVQVTESFKKCDAVDKNELEHVLEELTILTGTKYRQIKFQR